MKPLNIVPTLCAFACLTLFAETTSADAIMLSRAMLADTIAEYFIEEDQVRLELEIGAKDIEVFRNLLPDELYQQLGYGDAPFKERLARFLSEDMPVAVGDQIISGRMLSIGPGTRPLRDTITGEALPTPEDQAAVVVRATVVYPFDERPDSLTLVAPSRTGQANVGFVVYHNGVAVNDYRYLTTGLTVNLDWQDAWYSAFESRSMRRQYYSSMTGFIYVEPYEVRKEIIVRPADMQRYVDLGLEGECWVRCLPQWRCGE